MIESSEPARRVADALRDLEASFLITSQKQQWLDGEREDWLETVRLVARVVDRPLMTFGLLRVIGSLLNDLAMSLKEGSFVPAFTRPRTAVHATRRSLWHARVEAILISGIATDERDARVLEERYFSDVLRLRAPEASAQPVLLNAMRGSSRRRLAKKLEFPRSGNASSGSRSRTTFLRMYSCEGRRLDGGVRHEGSRLAMRTTMILTAPSAAARKSLNDFAARSLDCKSNASKRYCARFATRTSATPSCARAYT